MDENKNVRQAEPQNAPQDKQPAPLSEARKTALLRYMAVLFAVAFLLVLLSLILQAHSSKATISELTQTSSSALSNVEQLQAQNRDLQDEKQTLTQEKSELEAQVEDLQKQLDETKQADEKEESAEKLKLELELAHTKEPMRRCRGEKLRNARGQRDLLQGDGHAGRSGTVSWHGGPCGI